MSRNGSGTYTLPAGNPVVTGTTIASSWANNTMNDLAAALTDSVAADGQTPMTGDLDLNGNQIKNLADGTLSDDAATVGQVTAVTAGLGTMSTQNANAVAITGGAVNGTAVGNTTRSTVKATTLDLGLSTQSVAIGQGDSSSIKNRIINGAMVIDQRNAGASVTPTNGQYLLDRYVAVLSVPSKYSVQQNAGSVTPPAGFVNYLGVTSLSAYTVGASEAFYFAQRIEGFNTADLAWGTANAKTVTLSFWVRSSLTGSFGVALWNSATNRAYPVSYTISSANTWEQKSITIAGDTSGTWLTNNDVGIAVNFSLGLGSSISGTSGVWNAGTAFAPTGATSVVGTNGATFYLTGVQFEVGSQATGFEYRQYGTELALCQRYYYRTRGGSTTNTYGSGIQYSTSIAILSMNFPVTMRTAPTSLEQSGTAGNYGVLDVGTGITCTSVPTFNSATEQAATFVFTAASALTAGRATLGQSTSTNSYLGWSAEL
jgi:hypothetical protein